MWIWCHKSISEIWKKRYDDVDDMDGDDDDEDGDDDLLREKVRCAWNESNIYFKIIVICWFVWKKSM